MYISCSRGIHVRKTFSLIVNIGIKAIFTGLSKVFNSLYFWSEENVFRLYSDSELKEHFSGAQIPCGLLGVKSKSNICRLNALPL